MTASSKAPSSFRIWEYTTASGGIEKNLKLNSHPLPTPKPDEHLVQVIATALNPVDYKPAEAPLLGNLLVKKPATPGIDIAGRIVTPAAGSPLKAGQQVFGAANFNPFAAGGLAEYVAVNKSLVLPIPEGVSAVDAAGITVAGITAYQAIVPHVKKGDRVFLNGGSGGTGLFGIQIAKQLGCHVTVTCSSKNVDFVKQYGADEVIDYTQGDVLKQLQELEPFDHVVENVGSPRSLYFTMHLYTNPKAKYMNVASAPSLADLGFMLKAYLLPGFLGGGKRKFMGVFAQPRPEDLQQIVDWMQEGKVKAVIDSRFPFEQAPEAISKQKGGRARGKIVVDVAP